MFSRFIKEKKKRLFPECSFGLIKIIILAESLENVLSFMRVLELQFISDLKIIIFLPLKEEENLRLEV